MRNVSTKSTCIRVLYSSFDQTRTHKRRLRLRMRTSVHSSSPKRTEGILADSTNQFSALSGQRAWLATGCIRPLAPNLSNLWFQQHACWTSVKKGIFKVTTGWCSPVTDGAARLDDELAHRPVWDTEFCDQNINQINALRNGKIHRRKTRRTWKTSRRHARWTLNKNSQSARHISLLIFFKICLSLHQSRHGKRRGPELHHCRSSRRDRSCQPARRSRTATTKLPSSLGHPRSVLRHSYPCRASQSARGPGFTLNLGLWPFLCFPVPFRSNSFSFYI